MNKELIMQTIYQYCGKFQSAFKNSNGTARNAKVMIDVNNPHLEIYKFKINK